MSVTGGTTDWREAPVLPSCTSLWAEVLTDAPATGTPEPLPNLTEAFQTAQDFWLTAPSSPPPQNPPNPDKPLLSLVSILKANIQREDEHHRSFLQPPLTNSACIKGLATILSFMRTDSEVNQTIPQGNIRKNWSLNLQCMTKVTAHQLTSRSADCFEHVYAAIDVKD